VALAFGAYVWKRRGEQWLLQQNRPLLGAATNFGTVRAILFLREGSLPTLRVGDVHHTPDRDVHPAHLDAWYARRLPEKYKLHYGEGLVLPETERLQFVWLKAPYHEWIAVAGHGINEYPGDSVPALEQCLETALNVRRWHLEETGEKG
jgi:hypothetical protein